MLDCVLNDYFEWLHYLVKPEQKRKRASYKKLLQFLHSIKFHYFVDYDENRAADGVNLRWYFVDDGGDREVLEWDEPCTVLEMLIALAYQMDKMMEDPDSTFGLGHWFWCMIENLQLDEMTDGKFNKGYVYDRIQTFMNRTYQYDGTGNIFTIKDVRHDMRHIEIWIQACWYLDTYN